MTMRISWRASSRSSAPTSTPSWSTGSGRTCAPAPYSDVSEPVNVGDSIATASPGPEHRADHEVDRLAGAGGDDDLVGVLGPAGAAAVLGQLLAQAQQPLDGQVLQPGAGVARGSTPPGRAISAVGSSSSAGKPAASGIASRPAPSDSASICSA